MSFVCVNYVTVEDNQQRKSRVTFLCSDPKQLKNKFTLETCKDIFSRWIKDKLIVKEESRSFRLRKKMLKQYFSNGSKLV